MTIDTPKIPLGYKQTEIGMIPADWDICPLLAAIHIASGQVDPKQGPYKDMILVAPDHIERETGRLLNKKTAAEQKAISGKYIFESGDIVYSKIRPYLKKAILANFNGLCSADMYPLKPVIGVSGRFMLAVILGHRFSQYTESVSVRSGIPKINREELVGYSFALPPLLEQTAIAAVLFDMDSLIEKIEKLVKKKRDIKQGVMQDLLTGKRRLPGFSANWERKTLGKLGEVTGSGVDKKIRSDEVPVRLVNFLDVFHKSFIYSKDLHHQVTARPEQLLKRSVEKGDIFFTPSSEMPFDIGLSAVAMENIADTVYSYHIVRLRLFEDWDLLFRAYIFQTKDFSNQTATQCEGSGKRYVLNLTTFRERLTVCYPTDREEQSAIGRILFDMDAEIERLESQLIKYQNIKQGMIQALLTGKIRLITK